MSAGPEHAFVAQLGDAYLRRYAQQRFERTRRFYDSVHHFTDQVALERILAGGRMRATNALEIVGAEEILPALDMARDIAADDPRYAGGYRDSLLSRLELFRSNDFDVKVYVTCFCLDADDGYLWHQFGNDGKGYMLSMAPRLYLRPASLGDHEYFRDRVCYNPDEQRTSLREAVESGLQVFRHAEAEVGHHMEGDLAHLLTRSVAAEIAQRVVIMKPETFHREKEWRFVYVQVGNAPLPVAVIGGRHRVSLPITAADFEGEKLPVTRVLLGKYASLSEGYVQAYLETHGYDPGRVAVERSDIEPVAGGGV